MSVGDLARAYGRWEMEHHRPHSDMERIMVPVLDVYAPDGTLIYHGMQEDAGRAAQVLDALPSRPSPPPAAAVRLSLGESLSMTPELAKLKNTIMSGHHFVVVSMSMKGKWQKVNPYYEQNHAVDTIPRRPGVKIDIVRVNLVFPQS